MLEELVIEGDWWDTTDSLSGFFGIILKEDENLREKYNKIYLEHENMWMRRISLLYQLKYKEDFEEDRIFANIKVLMGEDEFFIRKAIGWILREHSKWSPQGVIDFVKENEKDLSHLSKVEAMKYMLKNKDQEKFKNLDIPIYAKTKKKAKK